MTALTCCLLPSAETLRPDNHQEYNVIVTPYMGLFLVKVCGCDGFVGCLECLNSKISRNFVGERKSWVEPINLEAASR